MSYQITHTPALSPPTAQEKVSFLESFYRISDTESRHDDYVASFTNDATLIMGSKVAVGPDEIRTLRHGLWTHVASRSHTPKTVYFASDSELMLYGIVKYTLRAGGENEIEVPWAARVVFGEGRDGNVKMKFYQVYLDPSAQSGKK